MVGVGWACLGCSKRFRFQMRSGVYVQSLEWRKDFTIYPLCTQKAPLSQALQIDSSAESGLENNKLLLTHQEIPALLLVDVSSLGDITLLQNGFRVHSHRSLGPFVLRCRNELENASWAHAVFWRNVDLHVVSVSMPPFSGSVGTLVL